MDPNLLKDIKDLLPKSTMEKLLNPAANEVGKGIGALLSIIFSPIVSANVIEKKWLANFATKISNKIGAVPPKDQDFSKPGLAIKALEDSRYQLNEELLREMFANLIASGVDKQKNEYITPRYATVLSQLGADDAKFLEELYEEDYPLFPASRIRYSNLRGDSYIEEPEIYLCNKNSEIKEVPQATISVLQSLGIIQLKEGQYINETSFNKKYALLKSFLISKSNDSEKNKNLYLRIIPSEIVLPAFGASLFQCIF